MTGIAMPAEESQPLAATPPMGWNSWNTFRCKGLTEQVVVETAEAIVATGMREAGYRYVVVDDCWQAFRRGPEGGLRSHPGRFPSGMAALGEQIHARGLKFGLYLSPGRKTCAMIYDRYPGEELGSFGRERQDIETLAGWGVDYLKYDWCRAGSDGTGLEESKAFTVMSEAIKSAGRPMVYSISEYGRSCPWEWAPPVANLWRTTSDIEPTWKSVKRIVDRQHGLARYARPGAWNDPDMLEVGNVGLSAVESRSHLMLWAMLAAPLMAGNDLRTMSDETRALLTDASILAIAMDRASRQGERIARQVRLEFWRRELSDGHAIGVLNCGRSGARIGRREQELLSAGGAAADVTTGEVDRFDLELAPHEMRLWRIAAS